MPLQPAAAAPSLRRYGYREQSYEKHEETGVGEGIGTAQWVLGPRCWDLCLAVSLISHGVIITRSRLRADMWQVMGTRPHTELRCCVTLGHTHTQTHTRQAAVVSRKISVFGPRNVGFILGVMKMF